MLKYLFNKVTVFTPYKHLRGELGNELCYGQLSNLSYPTEDTKFSYCSSCWSAVEGRSRSSSARRGFSAASYTLLRLLSNLCWYNFHGIDLLQRRVATLVCDRCSGWVRRSRMLKLRSITRRRTRELSLGTKYTMSLHLPHPTQVVRNIFTSTPAKLPLKNSNPTIHRPSLHRRLAGIPRN